MHSKIVHFLFIAFLISSCGGSSSTATIADDDIVLNPVNETCKSIGINTKRCSFIHDDLERYYLIYTPSSMGNDNVPMLFALHGYGSSAMIHKSYTQYEELAEQNKFIIFYPQGYKLESLLVNSSSHWNVGAWTASSNINDIDFIETIIVLISDKYHINSSRIYSSGMSNGGFMSYHLACNLSSKIAAIASVTGSMSKETLANCSSNHPTAILQIHGLEDLVVPYVGFDELGMEPIDDVLNYWADINNCNPERIEAAIDFINTNNSVDLISYESCSNNVDVKLIRIPFMGHTWPDLNNFNISDTQEIWNFLSEYDLNGKIVN